MTSPSVPSVRDRVAAYLAGAAGQPAVDVADALEAAGLLAPDQPTPAPTPTPPPTRPAAALTLAQLADGHPDNADVYIYSPHKAREAYLRAQHRLLARQLGPDEHMQALTDAWEILNWQRA